MKKPVPNKYNRSSLPAFWYLEQQLKLRAIKLNPAEQRSLNRHNIQRAIPLLRIYLLVYAIFNILYSVEEIVYRTDTASSAIGRLIMVLVTGAASFAASFFAIKYQILYIISNVVFFLSETIFTSYGLYHARLSEFYGIPVSPFVIVNMFFYFQILRLPIRITSVLVVVSLLINEICVFIFQGAGVDEITSILIYCICAVVAFVLGYINEGNVRSRYFLSREIEKDRKSMQSEREKAETLLYNILPRSIADNLKKDLSVLTQGKENDVVADYFINTTIAFCDIVGFTVLSSEMSPEKIVNVLNEIFSSFDNLVMEFNLEKIKTIGDAYMFAGGISKLNMIQTKHGLYTPSQAVAEMALLMQTQIDSVSKRLGINVNVRIGISSGPVAAGIVGISKFVYDLFGETVNLASKMESTGQAGRIHVSEDTFMLLQDKYDFESGPPLEMKDQTVPTFFMVGRKADTITPDLSSALPRVDSAHDYSMLRSLLQGRESLDGLGPAPFGPFTGPPKPSPALRLSPSMKALALASVEHRGAAHEVKEYVPTQEPQKLQASSPGMTMTDAQVMSVGSDDDEFSNDGAIIRPLKVMGSPGPRPHSAISLFPGKATSRSKMSGAVKTDSGALVTGPAMVARRSTRNGLDHAASAKKVLNSNAGLISIPQLGGTNWLWFKGNMEAEFQKDFYRKMRRFVQLTCVLAAVTFLLLGVNMIVAQSRLPPSSEYILLGVAGMALAGQVLLVAALFIGEAGAWHLPYISALQTLWSSLSLLAIITTIALVHPPTGSSYLPSNSVNSTIENSNTTTSSSSSSSSSSSAVYNHTSSGEEGQFNFLWNAVILMLVWAYVLPGVRFTQSVAVSVFTSIYFITIISITDKAHIISEITTLALVVAAGLAIAYQKNLELREAYWVSQTMDEERRKLTAERAKSEKLLYSILPQKIAARLQLNQGSIAETYLDVSVMFVSIHNFTTITTNLNPIEKVSLLNKIFSKFDKLSEQHKVEKIKTIGATYLVVGGLPVPRANHLSSIADLALDMQDAISQLKASTGERFKLKAGIHFGKVVAGVIGINKFSYDLWGDTVNTASRMESHSVPGKIQVTEACQRKLQAKFEFSDRGFIQVKGKGMMHTFFLSRSTKPKSNSMDRLPNTLPGGNFD